MRHPPVFSIVAAILAAFPCAHAQLRPEAQPARATAETTLRDQLKTLRKAARTPAEKVAVTDAWLNAHPRVDAAHHVNSDDFQARMAALASRPAPPRPTAVKGSLAWEVSQVWHETFTQARTPQEAVKLTDEFLRLNADALRELAPRFPSWEERRASLLQMNAEHPVQPGDLRGEIARVLCETRAEARTPAETVALTDEFILLNAAAISESKSRVPKTGPSRTPQ